MQNKYGIGDTVMITVKGTVGEVKFDTINNKLIYGIAINNSEFAYVAEDKVSKLVEQK